jgi:hypothetical protein
MKETNKYIASVVGYQKKSVPVEITTSDSGVITVPREVSYIVDESWRTMQRVVSDLSVAMPVDTAGTNDVPSVPQMVAEGSSRGQDVPPATASSAYYEEKTLKTSSSSWFRPLGAAPRLFSALPGTIICSQDAPSKQVSKKRLRPWRDEILSRRKVACFAELSRVGDTQACAIVDEEGVIDAAMALSRLGSTEKHYSVYITSALPPPPFQLVSSQP